MYVRRRYRNGPSWIIYQCHCNKTTFLSSALPPPQTMGKPIALFIFRLMTWLPSPHTLSYWSTDSYHPRLGCGQSRLQGPFCEPNDREAPFFCAQSRCIPGRRREYGLASTYVVEDLSSAGHCMHWTFRYFTNHVPQYCEKNINKEVNAASWDDEYANGWHYDSYIW